MLPGRQADDVAEELVVVVPEVDVGAADVPRGVGDVDEVLEVLRGHVLAGVVFGELEEDGQHRGGEAGHPAGAVALFELAAVGQGLSMPRKSPPKLSRPSKSLRLTQKLKLKPSISF